MVKFCHELEFVPRTVDEMRNESSRVEYYVRALNGHTVSISRTSYHYNGNNTSTECSTHLAYGVEYPSNFVSWSVRSVGDTKYNVYSLRSKKQVPTPTKGYRKFALEYKPNRCERCGEDDEMCLEVHHKDRNRDNNKLSNLAILCANCHCKEHRKTSLIKEPQLTSKKQVTL